MTTAARTLWGWTTVVVCCVAPAQAEEDDVRRILAQYDAMEDKVTVSVGGASARLKNGLTDYVMTALDTQPGTADPSTLGMNEPINANFYYGGFLRIRAGTVQTGLVKPGLAKGADHTGAACVTAVWELKNDTFTMNFTLLPDSSALMVELASKTGRAAKTPFFVRFRIYPQSFNRSKHGNPRANYLLSSTDKRIESGTIQSFGVTEKWIYLGDAKYAGKQGGAAIGVDPATMKDLKIHLGNYAAGADLSFKPGKTVRCYLVDFGKREIKDAPEEVPLLMSAEAARFQAWTKATDPAARGAR
ncbi:MAG: hypothetical protein QGG69_03825 [Kiritimatiellia bacterium]|jgi:hypothetical protein|nr:hypothetical protein [Kiritimatiellia bacterium]